MAFQPLKHLAFSLLAVPLILIAPGVANDAPPQRSAWHCLPDETTVAVRLGNGRQIVEAFKTQTKLGNVFFNEDRLERAGQLMKEHNPNEWQQMHEDLAKYGLAPEDFPRLFAGESGFALVVEPRKDDPTMPLRSFGLSWIEPGGDLAKRIWEAVATAVADHEDDEHAVQRTDLEIEGRSVMHLTVPGVALHPLRAQGEEFDDSGESLEEEAAEEKATRQHLMLTRMGGRLVMANTFKDSQGVAANEAEQLKAILARFLAADSGGDLGFVGRVTSAEGVADALPDAGTTILEVLADLGPLIQLAEEASPNAKTLVDSLGIRGLGVVALRSHLAGTAMTIGMFAAAPVPRTHLPGLLDQPLLAPEPPAWVPASVISYRHVSADLGAIYSQIKQMVITHVGPPADQQFQMVEMQVRGFAQAELATVLSSLGHQHSVLAFEPRIAAVDIQDNAAMFVQPGQRTAVIWKLRDAAIWAHLLRGLEGFAQMSDGAIQPADEQGFHGWRFKKDSFEGGLVLGNGYLVFAHGQGVLERTLSVLNTPPHGKDALRTSERFARAQSMIQLEPGLAFQFIDTNRQIKSTWRMINGLFGQLEQRGPRVPSGFPTESRLSDSNALYGQIRRLLPSDKEMEDVLGVAAGYVLVNDHGLVMKCVNELPPPD